MSVPGERAHVLLLDDAAVVRRVLAARLQALGMEVTAVCRNEEALGKLLRAAKGASAFDALVQDHERPVGGNGTRMRKVVRRMYADRVQVRTGLRLRGLPVLVMSGEPDACGVDLRGVDPTVRVLSKHGIETRLAGVLRGMWLSLRDRLVATTADSGVRVVRSTHGWVVDSALPVETPLFFGTAEQLEGTLARLDGLVGSLEPVRRDISAAR